MAKKNHIQRVHIWDDPESRINFLETTLRDKEWEAIIYEPVEQGTGRLTGLKEELDKKGYKTEIGKDANGIPTLSITHFSHETGLLKVFTELGLTAGIRQTFSTTRERIGNVLTNVKDTVDYYMSSEARRFSTLYAFGDIALGTLPNLYGKLTADKTKRPDTGITDALRSFDKKNKTADNLYDRAYDLALAQSLIMMFGMKEGKELIADEMRQGLAAAEQKGVDLSNFDNLMPEIKDRRSAAKKWFNDTAIFTGSGAQILGQIILVVSGLMRLRNTKAFLSENKNIQLNTGVNLYDQLKKAKLGAIGDVTTGSLSVAGWTLMGFFKEQTIENKAEWSTNFFKRMGQEIKSSPNTLASICVTLASVVGMKAGDLKHSVKSSLQEQQDWEWHRHDFEQNTQDVSTENLDALATFQNNKKSNGFNKQVIGNGIYLIGDMTVALTKNRNYESGQIANIDAMANTAIALLEDLPVAFSQSRKNEFINKLSAYMAKRLDNLHDPKKPRPEAIRNMSEADRLALFTAQIRNEITSKEPELGEKFERVVSRATDVAIQFNASQHNEVITALADTLSQSKTIAATPDEIADAIKGNLNKKIMTELPPNIENSTALSTDIQRPLSALVDAIPGSQSAKEAMELYSAVKSFLGRSQPGDAKGFADRVQNEQNKSSHPRINQSTEAGLGSSLS